MKRKKTAQDKRARKPADPKEGQRIAARSAARGVPEEELQGPPAAETVLTLSDAEIGEEAVGGSDDLGRALGVPRAPDEEVRTSAEILEARDRNRWNLEQPTGGDA
jgi:hypothetical protein